MLKKLLSVLLTLAMLLSMIPAGFAADIEIVENEIVGAGVPDDPADGGIRLVEPNSAEEIKGITASGQCGDNLTWEYDDDTRTLSIRGSGSMWDFQSGDNDNRPWTDFVSKITEVILEPGMTSIGKNAFRDCSKLSNVSIPDSVNSIGNFAFCNCSNISSAIIPDGVKSIGIAAFSSCNSLTSVTIPSSVTSIENGVFTDCSSLVSITIPNRVTRIGDSAFSKCSNLKEIILPDCVTSIGRYAFSDCSGLTSVTIPEGVTVIEEWSFSECTSLTSVKIPSSVTIIDDYAFFCCDNLSNVTIPDGMQSIGYYSFSGCRHLKNIKFLGGPPDIKNNCFSYVTATAYYPNNGSWWEDDRQDYGGKITWVPYGEATVDYTVTLTDYTGGKATSSLDFGAKYSGELSFTVSADSAVVVAVKKGEEYTALKCSTMDGEHRFTLTVTEDTELVFAFRGDVNLDGTVKSSEVTMIKRAIAGTYKLKNGMAALTADINGDGTIKSSDATMLARSIAGTYTIKW